MSAELTRMGASSIGIALAQLKFYPGYHPAQGYTFSRNGRSEFWTITDAGEGPFTLTHTARPSLKKTTQTVTLVELSTLFA